MDVDTSDCGYTAHPRCMWSPQHSWSNTSTNLGRFRHSIEQKYQVKFGGCYYIMYFMCYTVMCIVCESFGSRGIK